MQQVSGVVDSWWDTDWAWTHWKEVGSRSWECSTRYPNSWQSLIWRSVSCEYIALWLKHRIKMGLGELEYEDTRRTEVKWLRVKPSGRPLWSEWWALRSVAENFLISWMAYQIKEEFVSYRGASWSCDFPWLPYRQKSFHLVDTQPNSLTQLFMQASHSSHKGRPWEENNMKTTHHIPVAEHGTRRSTSDHR